MGKRWCQLEVRAKVTLVPEVHIDFYTRTEVVRAGGMSSIDLSSSI